MKRKILSILLIVLLVLTAMMPIMFAQTNKSKKQDLENKIDNAKDQKAEVTSEKKTVLGEISDLNTKISTYEKEIGDLNTKISNLKKSITANEAEIKKLEKEFKEKQQAFIERMVAIYEGGQTTYLDVLLSSDDIVSFISNYYMIEELADADKTMMDSIQAQQTKIEQTKKELESQKKEVTTSRNAVEAKNQSLNNAKSAKQSKVNSLSAKEKKLQSQIAEYESDLKSVEKQIREYEERQRQLSSSQKSNSGGSSSTPKYTGGKLGWPVQGYYNITSPYGYRIHPIYGTYKLHTGIDVGAPKNARFVAAEDGVVISASYSGGYGNRVIVSHGNGLTTLYAHGTSILVNAGQTVKKGQAVLTVGSTGLSTGNHAHFEVRVNGDYVNPMNYLQ